MSEHDPLCPYAQPCPEEWRNDRTIKAEGLPVPHRIVSGSSGQCVECDAGDCVCDLIREVIERTVEVIVETIRALPWTAENWFAFDERDAIIAAIKGDGDE
jgi:hypothetical protein